MKINRKDFLKSSLILGGGLFLPNHKINAFSRIFNDDSKLKLLRGNVGKYNERGGTIGWYISDDAVIIIDSQFADTSKNMLESLKHKSTRKIDILFNTHHHNDHTSGNKFLSDYVGKIVAHKNCAELQIKVAAASGKENEIAAASETFENEMSFDLGKEKLNAFYFGNAHTSGDAIYHFENANVVHIGDLVFNDAYPYIDNWAGATLKGWPAYIDYLYDKFDNDTIFIFGHGDGDTKTSGRKEDLLKMKNYLNSLYEFTMKKIKEGISPDEFKSLSEIPGIKASKELWPGAFKHNLEASYKFVSENN